jgi:RNA polymerase subunit RPABC4/transcription elongation factor Spt4
MTLDRETLNNILLFVITAIGAVTAATWLGLILWTWRDMRQRSRDPLAQIAASLMVAVLGIFGLVIYVMLRPSETLVEAYERSLEEEALLQNIEEKPVCPGCGRPIREEWQVCPYCHTKLKKPCIQCERMLELAWNLCPYCATSQVPYESEEPVRRAAPRRRNTTAPSTPPSADTAPADAVEFIEDDVY